MDKLYDIQFESGEINKCRTASEIKDMISEGSLTGDDQIRKSSGGSWHQLSSVDGLSFSQETKQENISEIDKVDESTNVLQDVDDLKAEALVAPDAEEKVIKETSDPVEFDISERIKEWINQPVKSIIKEME